MFAGIHFDFQFEISLSTDFRSESEDELDRVFRDVRSLLQKD